MNNSKARRRSRTRGGMVVFLLLLIIVGFLLQGKIRMMFSAYVERQVSMQA